MLPDTQTSSPSRAPLRRISAPAATSPIAVSESAAGPGVETESPPSNVMPKQPLVIAKPAGECFDPAGPERCRQCRRQQIMQRTRAHCREIGEVHSQQLFGDQVRRVLGEEMHAGDHRIGGHHQPIPGAAFDKSGVVKQAKATGRGERCKVAAECARTRPAPSLRQRDPQPSPLHIGRSQAAAQPIEHAVGERRLLPGKEGVGDRGVLADRHACRHVRPMQQFPCTGAQDCA